MVTDSKHKKAAVAAVVGNVMEWYDFAVYAYVASIIAKPGLEFRGLMTMAALSDDERVQRAAFGRLRGLKQALESAGTPVAELSMGMSGDFEAAVEEGATMVRLGTILFGRREP